jgi:hypothetical protein
MYITATVCGLLNCALVLLRLLDLDLLFPLCLFFLSLVFGSWDRLLGRRTAAAGVGAAARRGPAPPLSWRPIERTRGALQRAFPFALALVLARRPPSQAVEVRVRVALVVGAALTLRVTRHTTRWSRQVRNINVDATDRGK